MIVCTALPLPKLPFHTLHQQETQKTVPQAKSIGAQTGETRAFFYSSLFQCIFHKYLMMSAVCSVEVVVNKGPKSPAVLLAVCFLGGFSWQWCFMDVM